MSVWPLWKYFPLCDLLRLFPRGKEELVRKYSTVKDAAVKSEVDNVTGRHLGSVVSFYLLHKQDTKSTASHLDR